MPSTLHFFKAPFRGPGIRSVWTAIPTDEKYQGDRLLREESQGCGPGILMTPTRLSMRSAACYLGDSVGLLLVCELSGRARLAAMLGVKTAQEGLEDAAATGLLRRGLGDKA